MKCLNFPSNILSSRLQYGRALGKRIGYGDGLEAVRKGMNLNSSCVWDKFLCLFGDRILAEFRSSWRGEIEA